MPNERNRVAVIGGSGFVGRHVVDACMGLFDAVRIVDVCGQVLDTPSGTEMVLADIGDPAKLEAALRGCSAAIHCAGIVDTRSGPLHDERIHRANVAGTAAVIEACRREKVEALVFVSSHSAESDGVWGDDAGALRGEGLASAYGRSKRAAERAVLAAHGAAGAASLSTVSVRPQVVFGLGDPLFTESLLTGRAPPPLVGGGRVTYTPIYAPNLAGLLAAAARALLAERRGEMASAVEDGAAAARATLRPPVVPPRRPARLGGSVLEAGDAHCTAAELRALLLACRAAPPARWAPARLPLWAAWLLVGLARLVDSLTRGRLALRSRRPGLQRWRSPTPV